jgi:hypothetical protein
MRTMIIMDMRDANNKALGYDRDRSYATAMSRKQAVSMMPWACKVIGVCGAWLGFETIDDYTTWTNQK